MSDSRLLKIWTRKEWGGEMTSHDSVLLVKDKGIQDAVSYGKPRQITIIEQEVWTKVMQQLAADMPPQTRRANLLLEGIKLKLTKGKTLVIGDCLLEIKGETTPCIAMDFKLRGLQSALMPDWNGGAYASVIRGGTINTGDKVYWL